MFRFFQVKLMMIMMIRQKKIVIVNTHLIDSHFNVCDMVTVVVITIIIIYWSCLAFVEKKTIIIRTRFDDVKLIWKFLNNFPRWTIPFFSLKMDGWMDVFDDQKIFKYFQHWKSIDCDRSIDRSIDCFHRSKKWKISSYFSIFP